MLFLCGLLLALCVGIASPTHAFAVVGDTFKADIPNGGKTVECTFMVTGDGTVQVGDGSDVAIDAGTSGPITIPDEVTDGATNTAYKVTAVGDYAFYSCRKIESTGLEANTSVTCIGVWAYNNCDALTSTGLGSNSSVTEIAHGVFQNCDKLVDTGLATNSSVTTIYDDAFSGCALKTTGLETNTTLTDIAPGTFFGCWDLESVVIGKDSAIVSIAANAFDPNALKELVIQKCPVPAIAPDVYGPDVKVYYPVIVNNGVISSAVGDQYAGTNSFAKGAAIVIKANDPAENQKFTGWTVDAGTANVDPSAPMTSFELTETGAVVTAHFEDLPTPPMSNTSEGSGAGDGANAQGDAVLAKTGDPIKSAVPLSVAAIAGVALVVSLRMRSRA